MGVVIVILKGTHKADKIRAMSSYWQGAECLGVDVGAAEGVAGTNHLPR